MTLHHQAARAAAVTGALLALLLAACGRSEPEPPREEHKALQRAIEAPQERARAVEADVMEAKQRADREIEEQGG